MQRLPFGFEIAQRLLRGIGERSGRRLKERGSGVCFRQLSEYLVQTGAVTSIAIEQLCNAHCQVPRNGRTDHTEKRLAGGAIENEVKRRDA